MLRRRRFHSGFCLWCKVQLQEWVCARVRSWRCCPGPLSSGRKALNLVGVKDIVAAASAAAAADTGVVVRSSESRGRRRRPTLRPTGDALLLLLHATTTCLSFLRRRRGPSSSSSSSSSSVQSLLTHSPLIWGLSCGDGDARHQSQLLFLLTKAASASTVVFFIQSLRASVCRK